MQRIAILGSSGSGKSTLARALGARLGLPVTHLDALYWQPGWHPTPDRPAFDAKVVAITLTDRWIIEGGYSSTIRERLERADTVVLLAFPRWLCLSRVVRRRLAYAGSTRPDMAPGCPERIDPKFFIYVWNWRRKTLPQRDADIAAYFRGKLVRLAKPRDVAAFLETIPAAPK